jgi:hypothetical protein
VAVTTNQVKNILKNTIYRMSEQNIDQIPDNNKPEMPAINAIEEQLTTNNQPQAEEEMEVHHHPDLHHKPKPWKEYLLEGLMIFLAVTMGFIAENIRESIKEKREINENIESVLSDLKADVLQLNNDVAVNTYSYTAADSLIALLHNNINNTAKIYFYGRAVTANVLFSNTNSKTFDLMKSSGLLKLIDPRQLLDSLGLYYVTFALLSKEDDLVRLKMDEVHKGNHLLFDTYVFSQMRVEYNRPNNSYSIVQPPLGQPALLSTEYKTVNEVALNYYYLSATLKFDCVTAVQQKKLALSLIELIKKEYHLENE